VTRTWRIGDVTITKIVELEDEVPPGRAGIAGIDPDELADLPWLVPDFLTPEGRMRMSIHSFLVETPRTRIVVDTGLGNDKPRAVPHWSGLRTGFLDEMRATGWPPSSVQRVIHTHLHIDHVGWNTLLVDGAWAPTFPQARHLMVRADFEHWQAEAARTDDDRPGWLRAMTDVAAVWADSIAPVAEAGLVDLVEPDARPRERARRVPRGVRGDHRRPRALPVPDCAPALDVDAGLRPRGRDVRPRGVPGEVRGLGHARARDALPGPDGRARRARRRGLPVRELRGTRWSSTARGT
jgi:glyoxylase-like metal-dependent hydrolase (beta-lactamase superfamily II)